MCVSQDSTKCEFLSHFNFYMATCHIRNFLTKALSNKLLLLAMVNKTMNIIILLYKYNRYQFLSYIIVYDHT